jgi:NPCBM/NEW2 domain
MNRTRVLVKSSLLLALASLASLPAAPPDPVDPSIFRADVAEGKPRQGMLRELTKDWSLRIGSPEDAPIPGKDLLGLRRVGVPLPSMTDEPHLILVNGDRVPMDKPRLAGERLHFRHPDLGDGKEVQAPMSTVALLWLDSGVNAEEGERLRRRLLAGPRKRDRVLLLNGDAVEGDLSSLDANKVVLEDGKKKTTLDLKQVAAIVISSELAETFKPRGLYARAVLLGGVRPPTRLTLTSATSDGVFLRGVTTFGAELKVSLERLAALDLFGGAAVYLSDLKPSKYEFLPYLDLRWPLVTDGSVAGGELRVGSSVYAKGLGMHAHSRVSYTVAGGYRRFEALVGLDPRLGRQGSARIRVLADGKPLTLEGPAELSERQPALAVRVDVTGVKELTLETAFGPRGDIQAHVNWVDARLVK